jgi:chemotaxis protein methyltransferase CheR
LLAQFSKTDLLKLAAIVKELTGNNVQEKNLPMIESRLRARIMKLGLSTMDDYWSHYDKNQDEERHVLQGLMTTHYTFFFREYIHFETLEAWLTQNKDALLKRYKEKQTPVKVWSAACSRGQEVYSLAMFLETLLFKKHGIPFEILGTDVDQESIDYAQNGVYPIKEVSTIPQQYLNTYWKKGTGNIKDYAAVVPELRKRTRFQKLNLFELAAQPKEMFDIIFVRNVFIYFTADDVKKVATDLSTRLNQGGIFVSGVSEPLRFDGWNLESIAPSFYSKGSLKKPGATPAIKIVPAAPTPKTTNSQPTVSAQKPAPIAPTPAVELPSVELKRYAYKALCVDDSSTIQLLLKKILAQDPNCISVAFASNGEEARKKLDSEKFDIITLDIHMPVMDGIEFLVRAYKRNVDPPVLMLSSVNRKDADLATKALSLGAFDYVEKPAMNNLQKSSDEIITKIKMALRAKDADTNEKAAEDFNTSIGQKIVVPDASQCVRWVLTSNSTDLLLEPIIKIQSKEYRSPPLVISSSTEEMTALEAKVLSWTNRKVAQLRDAKSFLRPNCIYICSTKDEVEILKSIKVKNFSLQVLSQPTDLSYFSIFKSIQVLVDESLSGKVEHIAQKSGLRVSDITPSTSFVSLSLEYFADLRKANAA